MFLKRLILLEPPDPSVAEALTDIAAEFNLRVDSLDSPPPSNQSELAAELLGAEGSVIFLDQPERSNPWLQRLNQSKIKIPVIGLFTIKAFDEHFMEPLFKASALGLDAVIPLPLNRAFAREQLLRFFEPVKVPKPSAQPKAEALKDRVPAPQIIQSDFIANASPQNQRLLQTLVDNKEARNFCVQGPPACELCLLSREISARFKRSVELVNTPALSSDEISRIKKKPPEDKFFLYFIPLDTSIPEVLSEFPRLVIEPLQQRPADLAFYAGLWLPRLMRAARPQDSLIVFPKGLELRLLAYPWPGEFSELWTCLQRLALTGPTHPLPVPLSTNPDVDNAEAVFQNAAEAAFSGKMQRSTDHTHGGKPSHHFLKDANI